nr:NADH-quinone oxidoreductase subunit A [Pabstiella mirabilis]
MFLLHE